MRGRDNGYYPHAISMLLSKKAKITTTTFIIYEP